MPRTIVVPLDGSDLARRALDLAVGLAEPTGGSVQPMQVVFSERDRPAADRHLDALQEHYGPVVKDPYVIVGDWPAECIANAGDEPDTLVCLSSHGRGGVRRALLGSVAEDVVRLSNSPVLVMGPAAATTVNRSAAVMVTVDGSELSEAILPTAAQWWLEWGMAPWVVSVIEPSLRPTKAEESSYLRELVGRIQEMAGPETPDGTPGFDPLHGSDPAEAIVGYARTLPAGVIAMCTHGRTGLARFTTGSVAVKVVHDAPCPVLLQGPPEE